jgi:hypothetical protein
VKFTDVGIYSQGNLGIKYVPLTKGVASDPTPSGNSYSWAALPTAATDVSGDGITFYKPDWNPTSESAANSIGTITNGDPAATSYYYIQFALKLTNDSTANKLNVYLGNGTSIDCTVVNAGDTKYAANATRVALFDLGKKDADPTELLSGITPSTTNVKYLSTGASNDTTKFLTSVSGSSMYGVSNIGTTTLVSTPVATSYGFPSSVEPTSDSAIATKSFLTTIDTNSNKYIGVSIWLEGESAYCANDAIKQKVSVDLKFVAF